MDIFAIRAVTYLINVAEANIFHVQQKVHTTTLFNDNERLKIPKGKQFVIKAIGVKSYHIHKDLVDQPDAGITGNTYRYSTGKEKQKKFFPHNQ